MTMNIRSVIEIRYAQIRSLDLSNGEGVGVALFVQGCHFHCFHCFNTDTWDFNGGKEWTEEIKNKFLKLANRPYIKRVSILGGEPLAEENLDDVLDLVTRIRLSSPHKSIWLYTGYTWSEIMDYKTPFDNVIIAHNSNILYDYYMCKRKNIVSQCNIMIDGRYIDSQRDISLPYRGSTNQRIIDVWQSLQKFQKGEIVLWEQKNN